MLKAGKTYTTEELQDIFVEASGKAVTKFIEQLEGSDNSSTMMLLCLLFGSELNDVLFKQVKEEE